MATSRLQAHTQPTSARGRPPRGGRPFWAFRLLLALALSALAGAACAPVQPLQKVGLLAPFEGLHRRSGYEALAAARAAIDAAAPALTQAGVIPLALDTSLDTRRAAEKLLADPALVAVVGPLSPSDAAPLAHLLDASGVPWVAPYAVGPHGFLPATGGDWAVEWVRAVAPAAQAQGAARLVLAGWQAAGWPPPEDARWGTIDPLPLLFLEDPAQAGALRAGDALLWAGNPAQGAALLGTMRAAGSQSSFWLGPGSADATFAELASAILAGEPGRWGDVYYLTWQKIAYNGASAPHIWNDDEMIPSWHGTLTGAATAMALAHAAGAGAPARELRFRPAVFRIGPDGSLTPEPPEQP